MTEGGGQDGGGVNERLAPYPPYPVRTCQLSCQIVARNDIQLLYFEITCHKVDKFPHSCYN